MANRHFGKFADVWKHLILAEVLASEQPRGFAETHAGSAAYPLTEDGERQFGIGHFLKVAGAEPELSASRYRQLLMRFVDRSVPLCPGSPAIAMSALAPDSEVLLCDLDPRSVEDLTFWAGQLGVKRATVIGSDGIAAVSAWLEGRQKVVVHVDPFDPFLENGNGTSAITFAADVVRRGHTLVYWYGYDQPAESSWAHKALCDLAGQELWYGDMMIVDRYGAGSAGNLGEGTTAGTGSGVVLGNVGDDTVTNCERLGIALAGAYANVPLPSGEIGSVNFTRG